MGALACQCTSGGGHHIAAQSNVVEAINADERPVVEEDGELVVTPLMNYAMPFVRYRIGDRGRLTDRPCSCGREFPLLESVNGRVIEVLVNAKGEQVDPIYFIQLIGVVFNRGFVRKFQVIQDESGAITVKVVLEPGTRPEAAKANIDEVRRKILLVMGEDCPVNFDFVDDIPLSQSGKHAYVVRHSAAGRT